VEPLLNDPLIEFIGEVDDNEKNALLGDAMAVLFSIDWPEPFGLVLIEAMACGTPAIGFRRGAVPEVIEHGSTGFVVDSIDEAVAAIPAAQKLDRRVIRQRFVERFQVQRMARDYVDLYANVLRCGSADRTPRTAAAAD
jgi:glycosyltransferase involved in cell wall biosynthesis